MKVINNCCFKHDDKSYVVCFGHWKYKEKKHELKEVMDTLKCTNKDGSLIDIKLQNHENIITIEMEKGHSNIINIKTSKHEVNDIILHFPFEDAFIGCNNDINIISTMCRMYNFRLDEWINYHLNLGVDKIIIFNNTKNGAPNNQGDQDNDPDMSKVTNKYGDKVFIIDFPYKGLPGHHWNTLQSVSLFIGLHAMKTKAKYITFTDADEFITVVNDDIRSFCANNNKTFQLHSKFLTNKGDNDVIDNNILQICNYVGKDSIKKMMVYTENYYSNNPFFCFFNPHTTQKNMAHSRDIHFYHCWVNRRLKYNENMKYFNLLNKEEKEENEGKAQRINRKIT